MVSLSLILIRTEVAPSIIKSSATVFRKSCHSYFEGVTDLVSELRFKGHCELSSVYELAIKVCMSCVGPVK